MVQLHLSVDLENKVRERLCSGVDANELMEIALLALSERDAVRDAVMSGWHQADAGEFTETDVESVMRRASR